MTAGCDHKFVDSTSCIKCGWTPPLLNIVRVETEPPAYQVDVVRGVGWFRMPSEETMSDDLQASKAWQDVEQVLQQEPNLHVLKILIADAKAADAAHIAALEQQLTALPTTAAWQDLLAYGREESDNALKAKDRESYQFWQGWTTALERARAADAQQIAVWRKMFESSEATLAEARQQIAALRAENEQAQQREEAWEANCNTAWQTVDDMTARAEAAEAQLTALQAEQAQWQQKAMRYLRHEPDCHISIARMTLFDPACHANGLCSCGLVQLAALTAQQEKP